MSSGRFVVLLIGIFIVLVSGSLLLPKFAPLLSDPKSACANVPPAKKSIGFPATVLKILSPRNGEVAIAIYQLPIEISVEKFELNKNGKSIAVWIDNQPVKANYDSTFITISSKAFDEAKISLEDVTHDVCMTLIDDNTEEEVGNRVGLHIIVHWRGPDQLDWSGSIQICLTGILAVGIGMNSLVLLNPRTRYPN
jgi:hypothetical protein